MVYMFIRSRLLTYTVTIIVPWWFVTMIIVSVSIPGVSSFTVPNTITIVITCVK